MNTEELLKAIEQERQAIWPTDTGKTAPPTVPTDLEQGWLNALTWMERYIKSLPAEQPSEDLEEAAQNHAKEMYGENYMDFVYTQDAAFKAMSNFKFGAQWQKEQLMKNAVETKVKGCIDGKGIFIDTEIPIGIDVNEDDKVKIIIIKENEK